MSGEYFCIEEVADPVSYYEEYQKKSPKSLENEVHHFYRDNDVSSNTSRKSQDLRLHEIEEQLEVAENRCNTLKGKLDSMKQIYHKAGKIDPVQILRKLDGTSFISISSAKDDIFLTNNARKRSCSPKIESNANRNHSPSKKRSPYDVFNDSTTDTVPQKSSSSSTDTSQHATSLRVPVPIMRQNSNCISTDHTGAAVRTINNILSGITSSFNKLSKINTNKQMKRSRKASKDRSCMSEVGVVYEMPADQFSPRVERRMHEQQKRLSELAKNKNHRLDRDIEHWTSQKLSKTSVKSKSRSTGTWDRHGHGKKHGMKIKIHSSSGSINSKKQIKSTAKHVENTTKMRPIRTAMLDSQDSQLAVMAKKRKRAVKRLKPASKVSLCRKPSENESRKAFEQYTTDNLVELYHNIAAKESDSDDSNNESKTQAARQKAGRDYPIPVIQIRTAFDVENKDLNRQLNTVVQSARTLSPIEEHRMDEQALAQTDYFTSRTRNYALPTISSTLKRATKCYLNSFNFRSIPFCAAKSTSPSHNIGINIQQVMSIIKTRQPITGISPTLAHNISLAAGKLQSHPVHAFVSTLSSRIGNGRSLCPLTRSPINYNHLQELAKEIPEEPEEEQCGFAGDVQTEPMDDPEACVNGPSGDTQTSPEVPTWTVNPETDERCTCAPQRGVPFQHVLGKYQMSEASFGRNKKNQMQRPITTDHRPSKPTFVVSGRKQRSGTWIRRDSKMSCPVASKPSQTKDLQGREKNLKTVLNNLHDEFDSLNTKYEDLAKHVAKNEADTSETAVKELEEMELALNKKEEEINMVMSLFTEVMALKDQVKKLRERTSQGSVAVPATRSKTPEPSTAIHLTQLLKQIQNYQDRCKSRK